MMIPIFPEFKKLELSDKSEVEKITNRYPGYSDYNFISLWSYNTEDDIVISVLNDNLIVRFRDYVTNEAFYSFIGKNKVTETIETLIEYCEATGTTPILKLIPEENIYSETGLTNKFKVEEDPDNHDYILSVNEHSSLQTSKYYKHRKLINKFFRENSTFEIKELDLSNLEVVQQILELFYLWERKKGKKRQETQHELTALKRTLRDFEQLNLIILGLFVKNNLIGMTIADANHTHFIETHFSKYDPDYNGMNHILHHLLAKHLQSLEQKYINLEQDLGLEGLRRAKESANPTMYLKKYSISKLAN